MPSRGFNLADGFILRGIASGGADTLTDDTTGLLGSRFVGPVAAPVEAEDIGYAALARGVTGVLLYETTNGELGAVQKEGQVLLEVDGAYAVGATLTAKADGKGTVVAAGNPVLAKVLDASAADGDVIAVELSGNLPYYPAGT